MDFTPCATCDGTGIVTTEPHDWWYGSGVNAVEFRCDDCDGTGEAMPEEPPTDEERDLEEQAFRAHEHDYWCETGLKGMCAQVG